MAKLAFAGLTDRGQVRKRNEDSWLADGEKGLFIVSDGMGGHAAGDVASRMVVDWLPRVLEEQLNDVPDFSDSRVVPGINRSFDTVNFKVREEGMKSSARAGMGATVVLAWIKGGEALVAHLGDSRAYLLSGRRMIQLTKDHSVVQQLVDLGKISPDETLYHPARGQITRCMGMPQEAHPDVRRISLGVGDRLLLCSDGLTGMLDDEEIARLLVRHKDLDEAAHRLVEAANEKGGVDNIAVIVASRLEEEG